MFQLHAYADHNGRYNDALMSSNSHPDEDLLVLIGDTARLIGTFADRIARRQGMTKAQWVVLLRVERYPGLSQKDLAELMEVEPITIGRLVDRLEARGLVTREADDQDRRIWRLQLTPAARPLLQVIGGHRADIAAMIAAGIGEDTAHAMRKGLEQAKANVTYALRGADALLDPQNDVQNSKIAAAR
jgi:MarR family transcriptional regulator, transcriptional regulator for hemolysin